MTISIFCQVRFLTVAEASDFTSTSDYNDVMGFIENLKKMSGLIRVETIARSTEGLDLPLIIIGNPLPQSPFWFAQPIRNT
jgi:hypothetical protein